MSRRNAAEIVKAMRCFGYTFVLESGRTPVDPAALTNSHSLEKMAAIESRYFYTLYPFYILDDIGCYFFL